MNALRENNLLPGRRAEDAWTLQLFVAGETPSCLAAIRNARRIVQEFLPQGSKLQVIDLVEEGDHAEADQVLAIPTLIRRMPTPPRRIIGDLRDLPRVLFALGVEGYSRAQ